MLLHTVYIKKKQKQDLLYTSRSHKSIIIVMYTVDMLGHLKYLLVLTISPHYTKH